MHILRSSAILSAMIGIALLLILPLAVQPYLVGPDLLQPPSSTYWLGTNELGQDVALGVLRGGQATVVIALVTALLSLSISFVAGSVAALASSPVSGLVLRLTDLFEIIPSILILLLVAAWHQPGMVGVILLLGCTTWQDDVRPVRAILLRESQRENVLFAKSLGAGWFYLLARHILPAIWPALAGLYLQNVVQAVMRVAGLAFLGLTDPRLLTWGGMIRSASDYLYEPAWIWLLLPPTLALSLLLITIMLAGRAFELRSADGAAPSEQMR